MPQNLFEWDQKVYGLGVPNMDKEHQVLIGKMNRLFTLHENNAKHAELLGTLQDLIQYTKYHFRDEEEFMQSFGYSDYRKHKLIHENLLRDLDEYAKQFAETKQLPSGLFVFLKTWLKAHICGVDTKYAAQVNAA